MLVAMEEVVDFDPTLASIALVGVLKENLLTLVELALKMNKPNMKAKDFEQQFDEGVDITAALDLSNAKTG